MNCMIRFTKHAKEKFEILAKHGVNLSQDQIIEAINNPDLVDEETRYPLLIAQSELDEEHILRVVYRYEEGIILIITFYPGRKKQYG